MDSQTLNISLVDDEVLVTRLLSSFLKTIPNFNICSLSHDGSEFIEYLSSTKVYPDIVLLDLKMKKINGLETIDYVRGKFPHIKIISLTSHYKDSNLGYMVKTGVSAFLPKEISPDKLVQVINEVDQRGFYFSPEQLEILRKQLSNKLPSPHISLMGVDKISERELLILKHMCNQLTSSEIAKKMNISNRTVEGHRNNLYVKTGVKNLAGLIIYAAKNKLVNLEECELFTLTNRS